MIGACGKQQRRCPFAAISMKEPEAAVKAADTSKTAALAADVVDERKKASK